MSTNSSFVLNKFFLILMVLSSVALNGCPKSDQASKGKEVIAGEYYSFQLDSGDYKVLKVLLTETKLIHICYYNNISSKKPTEDAIKSLYFGEKQFQDAFFSMEGGRQAAGRKHMALTLKNWEYWKPEFLSKGKITPDELEAYEKWKNGDRDVSGILIKPTD